MHVIGTAGHVDHGKSTLIQALTGIHPDRLKEEREREMTIDLGFAWMTLPSDNSPGAEEIGIVDVPGHRDFIENMLAGIGGIDAVLFVVAADEGVMPQTREHLAILDLLQIKGGVIVLTKIDLIDDLEWLDLIESDIQQVLAGSVLEDAPILRVSARTGAGLEELKSRLWEILKNQPQRIDLQKPRLPVDRVFTIPGFGTVVTGTLSDGSLRVGDEIEVLPRALKGRIRGLQTHKQKEQIAVPGSRTAVNITGISLEEVVRGDVISHVGNYASTQRVDVSFALLPDVSQPLKHNSDVKLFIGTSETVARVRLLGIEELLPGESGWLQLELIQPIIASRADRYILRRPSPGETLGGGEIVDPHPKGRHKRFTSTTIASLETMSKGSPTDVLLQTVQSTGSAVVKDVFARSHLEGGSASDTLRILLGSGQIINLDPGAEIESYQPDDLLISKMHWEQAAQAVINELSKYHGVFPLRSGMPREELKSRMRDLTRGSTRLFNSVIHKLVLGNQVCENGPLLLLPDHKIRFNPAQLQSVDRLISRFTADPFSPPTVKECHEEVGEEVYRALLETGVLTEVASDVVFRSEDYQRMQMEVRSLIEKHGSITVAQARDHFNTSRRYILAFLEHLDAIGFTIRSGDERKLRH